ncbi:hypothetical protein AMTR_s00191p00045610 [Amborella trichopoda]|uniref:Uncharacterized protein n=1 Tax=Amborella trichopoda TaxID=13333 RepID=W1PWI4_AMBTC|nr:hypothetical protein AMTR_s00191p00045610 [Amborella trichopoda]
MVPQTLILEQATELLSISKQMANALPEASTPAPTKKSDPDKLNHVDSPGRPIWKDFEGDIIAQ